MQCALVHIKIVRVCVCGGAQSCVCACAVARVSACTCTGVHARACMLNACAGRCADAGAGAVLNRSRGPLSGTAAGSCMHMYIYNMHFTFMHAYVYVCAYLYVCT